MTYEIFKLSTKLMMLVTTLCMLIIMISGIGLYTNEAQHSEVSKMYKHSTLHLEQLDVIIIGILRNRLDISTSIIQPALIPERIEDIRANKKIIDEHFVEYLGSPFISEEERKLAQQFEVERNEFVRLAIEPAIKAMQANNIKELERIQINYVRPLGNAMQRTQEKLIRLQVEDARQEYHIYSENYKSLLYLLICSTLFTLIFSASLCISFIRQHNHKVTT